MQGRRRCLRDASLELARCEVLEGSLVARLRHLRSLEWFRTFCLCAEDEVIEFKPASVNVCLHVILAVCVCDLPFLNRLETDDQLMLLGSRLQNSTK